MSVLTRVLQVLRALPGLSLAFLAAVLIAAVLGSLVQTQLALAALGGLGVDIGLGERLQSTAADLVGFTPMYAAVVAAGFLLAFPVAALLARWLPALRHRLYALAGACAMLTALLLMQQLIGLMPIASARGVTGLTLHSLAGAAGGLGFAWLRGRRPVH
ncbi:MAG: hypothetical protein MUE46_02110 [Xanthomonadales bacterium]|jgi:hypothetical protein|nr:hypothetical protein [Xanthomonadales bacterium]